MNEALPSTETIKNKIRLLQITSGTFYFPTCTFTHLKFAPQYQYSKYQESS